MLSKSEISHRASIYRIYKVVLLLTVVEARACLSPKVAPEAMQSSRTPMGHLQPHH